MLSHDSPSIINIKCIILLFSNDFHVIVKRVHPIFTRYCLSILKFQMQCKILKLGKIPADNSYTDPERKHIE